MGRGHSSPLLCSPLELDLDLKSVLEKEEGNGAEEGGE